MRHNADFRVRGFRAHRLLLETFHTSETSASVEIEAWQSRMKRGEASHVELIDLRAGGELTNLCVTEHTKIGWSWQNR